MATLPSGVNDNYCYRILYIDQNTVRCSQVQKFFNQISEEPKFFCVPVSTYKLALQIIAVCHLDELAQSHGYKPFDFILFDINIKNSKDKYTWQKFIEHIFAMGLSRLNFSLGLGSFIAIGKASQDVKNDLLDVQITFLERPVVLEKIKQKFIKQLNNHLNSVRYSALKNDSSLPYKVLYLEKESINMAKMQIAFNSNKLNKKKIFTLVNWSSLDLVKDYLSSLTEGALETNADIVFDFIVFKLNFDEQREVGLDFIQFIFNIGLTRLSFPLGIGSLIAVGTCTESIKDLLLDLQISLLPEEISSEDLEQKLTDQIFKFQGASAYYIDPYVIEQSTERQLLRRVLRLPRSTSLPPLPTIILAYEESFYDDQGNVKETRPVFKRNADFFALLRESDPEYWKLNPSNTNLMI